MMSPPGGKVEGGYRSANDMLVDIKGMIEELLGRLPKGPRDPIRLDGPKISLQCELMIDGKITEGFEVSAFGIEYGVPLAEGGRVPWSIPGQPPIIKVYVESKAYVETMRKDEKR